VGFFCANPNKYETNYYHLSHVTLSNSSCCASSSQNEKDVSRLCPWNQTTFIINKSCSFHPWQSVIFLRSVGGLPIHPRNIAVIIARFWTSLEVAERNGPSRKVCHFGYTGCIKKKVIELQRAIIRESLGVWTICFHIWKDQAFSYWMACFSYQVEKK
jgi:hypothetical protein